MDKLDKDLRLTDSSSSGSSSQAQSSQSPEKIMKIPTFSFVQSETVENIISTANKETKKISEAIEKMQNSLNMTLFTIIKNQEDIVERLTILEEAGDKQYALGVATKAQVRSVFRQGSLIQNEVERLTHETKWTILDLPDQLIRKQKLSDCVNKLSTRQKVVDAEKEAAEMVKNITEEGEAITEIAEDTAEEMIRLEFCEALAKEGIAACSSVRDETPEVASESRKVPSAQNVTSSESEKPATPTERVEEEDKDEPSQESGKSPETGVVDSDASTVPGPVDELQVRPPIQRMEPEGRHETPVVDLEEEEEVIPSADVTLTNEPVAQSPEMSPIVGPSPEEVTLTSRQSALIPDEPSIRDISSPERKEERVSDKGLTIPKEVANQEVTAPLSDDDDGIYLTARSQVTPPKVELPKPPKLISLCKNVSGTLNRLFPDPRLGNSEVTTPRKSPRKPATSPTSPPQEKSPEGQKQKSPFTKKLTGKRKSSLVGASSSGKTTAKMSSGPKPKARKIVSPRPKTPDSSEDEDGMSNDEEVHATNAKVLFTAYEPRTNRKESGTPRRESRFNCVRCREHGLLSTQYGEAINIVDHFCPYEQCCCPTCKASKKSSAMRAEEVGDGLYKQKDSVFVDTMRGKVTVEDTEIGKQLIEFCKENQVTEATTNALLDMGDMYLNEYHVLTKLHESRQYTNFPVELLPFLPNKWRETIVGLLASADTDAFVQIKNYDQIMADLAEDNVKLITLTVSATLKEGPDSKQYVFGLFAFDTKQKTLQFEVLAPIIELGNLGSVRLRSLLGVALETEAIVDAMKYGVEHVVSTLGEGVDLEETPEELLDLFRKYIEKCDIAYILAQYVLHSTIYSPALEKRFFNYELFYRINWYVVLTHTHFSRRVERYLESILVDHWLKKLATPMRKINRESRHYFHVDGRKEIREDGRRRVEVYGQHVEALMKSTGKKPNFAIVKERMSTWRKSGKYPKEQLPGDIR